jgi:hypothetical protein
MAAPSRESEREPAYFDGAAVGVGAGAAGDDEVGVGADEAGDDGAVDGAAGTEADGSVGDEGAAEGVGSAPKGAFSGQCG